MNLGYYSIIVAIAAVAIVYAFGWRTTCTLYDISSQKLPSQQQTDHTLNHVRQHKIPQKFKLFNGLENDIPYQQFINLSPDDTELIRLPNAYLHSDSSIIQAPRCSAIEHFPESTGYTFFKTPAAHLYNNKFRVAYGELTAIVDIKDTKKTNNLKFSFSTLGTQSDIIHVPKDSDLVLFQTYGVRDINILHPEICNNLTFNEMNCSKDNEYKRYTSDKFFVKPMTKKKVEKLNGYNTHHGRGDAILIPAGWCYTFNTITTSIGVSAYLPIGV